MKISVLIPALNEAPRLPAAIASAWSAGADEVIVADGGSEDGTVDAARAAGAQVVHADRGRARQQNAAAALAQGDVLLFLHADTRLSPDAGAQIRRALRDESVLGGAFRQRIDAEGWRFRWLEKGNAWRAHRGRPYGDQAIFLRRETFVQLGGFPEVPLMEDVALMRRFRRLGKPVLLDGPLEVSARRWQKHGVVRQTVRNWLLLTAYRCGISEHQLARFYPRHDREPGTARSRPRNRYNSKPKAASREQADQP